MKCIRLSFMLVLPLTRKHSFAFSALTFPASSISFLTLIIGIFFLFLKWREGNIGSQEFSHSTAFYFAFRVVRGGWWIKSHYLIIVINIWGRKPEESKTINLEDALSLSVCMSGCVSTEQPKDATKGRTLWLAMWRADWRTDRLTRNPISPDFLLLTN